MHHYRTACRVFIYVLITSSTTNGDPEKPKSSIVGSMLSDAALIASMSKGSTNQSLEPSIFHDVSKKISNNVTSISNKLADTLEAGKAEAMNFSFLGVDSLLPIHLSQAIDDQTPQLMSSSFSGDWGWLDSLLARQPVNSSLISDSRSFMTMGPLLERLGPFTRMDNSLAGDRGSILTMDPTLIKDPGSDPDINTSSAGDVTSLTSMVSSINGSDASFLPIESFVGSITPNNRIQQNDFPLKVVKGAKLPSDVPLVGIPGRFQSIIATSDPFISDKSSIVQGQESTQFMNATLIGVNKENLTQGPTNIQSFTPFSFGGQTNVQDVERSSGSQPWIRQALPLGPAIIQNPESVGSLETRNHNFHGPPNPVFDGKPQTKASHNAERLEVPKTTIGEPSLKVFEKLPLVGNIHETVWKISKESNAHSAIIDVKKADDRVKGSSLQDTEAGDLSWTDPVLGVVNIPGDPVIDDNPQLQQDVSTGEARSNRSQSDLVNTALKPVSMSELMSLLNNKRDQIGNAAINFFNLGAPINNTMQQGKSSLAKAF
ncbi:hypothetical protein ACJMK2_011771 [Sinanodonta woodiana]|uniref:Uncharacterized protein n=1 Tax=Sinanodonta woodiana TaxID=1069815 RepID=A0ABD3V632_SINWO